MKYVVLGASAAGVNGVREIRKNEPDAEIVLVSKDDAIYSRCILHHYMSGMRTKEQLCFAEADFETRFQVDWRKGISCISLDEKEKNVGLSDGSRISYDKLLIATGSHAFLPRIPGLEEADGVYGFRDILETEAIRDRAKESSHIVVMGGGLTGLDAAVGFLHMGKTVDLVETADWLLPKQLDRRSAAAYETALSAKGICLHLGTSIDRILCDGNGCISGIELGNGETLPCDLMVVTAGVRPNVEFLEGTSVERDGFGLVIDQYGQTNVPDIYGAGDVTGRTPIWPVAVKQGMIAAANMTGYRMSMGDFFASKSTMNFLGIPTMSLGVPVRPDESYEELVEDTGERYRKIIHKGGKIHGAILQGDLSYGGVLAQLIARRIDVSKVKKPLFDIDYSDFFHTKDNFEFYYDET